MQLSTEKCVVSIFSTNPYEANYKPVVVVEGKQLEFQAEPVFLGITYDRTLSFLAQAQKAAAKLARGSQVLSALAGTDWGWSSDLLTRVYNVSILSSATYAAAAWQPWLSGSGYSSE